MSNIEIGKYGESLAAEYLVKKGFKIIEKNYRYSKCGEVDIIALDKDELCFIEVKTRTQNRFGTPLEAINRSKLVKILSCLKSYKTNVEHTRRRIDAVSIELGAGIDKKPKIIHIKNLEL